MTLRPEPLTALLVASVLLCTIRFVERSTAAPLAVAAILVPLAVTAHPSGDRHARSSSRRRTDLLRFGPPPHPDGRDPRRSRRWR